MGIFSRWRRNIIRGIFASEEKYETAEQQRSETFPGFWFNGGARSIQLAIIQQICNIIAQYKLCEN